MKIFFIGALLAFGALVSTHSNIRRHSCSNRQIPTSRNNGSDKKQQQNSSTPSDQQIAETFEAYDLNKNKLIDKEEFAKVFSSELKIKVANKELLTDKAINNIVKAFYQQYDKNPKDQNLNLQEFKNLVIAENLQLLQDKPQKKIDKQLQKKIKKQQSSSHHKKNKCCNRCHKKL